MNSGNYKAWNPQTHDFPKDNREEQIRFLLQFALLAPSGHNTQPWKFTIKADGKLEIRPDLSRSLPHSDPENRLLFMSLGAALQNFIRAAQSFDCNVTWKIKKDEETNIEIDLKKHGGIDEEKVDWIGAIIERTSNRNQYDTTKLATNEKEWLLGLSAPKIGLVPIESKKAKHEAAHIVAIGTKELLNSKSFRQELSMHVHNNWTRLKTGMPAFTQGLPGPPSLVASLVVKHTKIGNQQAKKDAKMLNDAPLLVIFSSQNDNEDDWIRAGIAYEDMFLRAVASGLSIDTYGSAIINESARKLLASKFCSNDHPQILVRVGRAVKKVRHTPRLGIEDVQIS